MCLFCFISHLTNSLYFRVFSSEDKSALYLTEFLTAVGMLKFRGTSSLFRLQKSAVKYDAVRNPPVPVLIRFLYHFISSSKKD